MLGAVAVSAFFLGEYTDAEIGVNAEFAVADNVVHLALARSGARARRVLEDFLGEHRPAFWISDRYGAQKGFARSGHQFCLAHLIRNAQYAVDAGDTGFAPGFQALLKRACRLGPLRDRLTDVQLAACHRKLVKKLSELLQRPATHPKGAKLQKAMARERPAPSHKC